MSGELLGRYELLSLIGEGAMGSVYRAQDTKLKRTVAIKVMSASMGNGPEAIARFEREARSLAALQHPQIVTIHDYLDMSGNLCLVMELINGQPLDKVIDQHHALSVSQKLAFMASVCRALDYAHRQGIIHRDLKPSNILMLPNHTPKIVDFGIAKMAEEGVTHKLTRTNTRIGTIAYMSPEQFNGELVDHRTDIFSAGVVLYELLSGISPFEGANTTVTMKKILIDPTPILPATAVGVPHGVHEILNQALAKEKLERYRTAAQFALALERFTSTEPVVTVLEPSHEENKTDRSSSKSAAPSLDQPLAQRVDPAKERKSPMLWAITISLFALWIIGLLSGAALGTWIHILLVLAMVMLAFTLLRKSKHPSASHDFGKKARRSGWLWTAAALCFLTWFFAYFLHVFSGLAVHILLLLSIAFAFINLRRWSRNP